MKRGFVGAMLTLALVALLFAGVPSVQAASGPKKYATAPNGVRFVIPAGTAADVVAFMENGFKPVLVPSGKMTSSSWPGVATERGPDRVLPDCLQPPAHLDLLHTPAKLLAEYGIAPRGAEPLSKWLAMESHAKHHVCSSYPTNAYAEPVLQNGSPIPLTSIEYQNDAWGGKIADQNCGSTSGDPSCDDNTHWYTETDTDYYINCPSKYTPQIVNEASISEWAGIGGTSSSYELQQGGVSIQYFPLPGNLWYTWMSPWYEYVGWKGTVSEQDLNSTYNIGCGQHMYTKVYGNNCVVIINLTENWTWDGCQGPSYDTQSAELIVERNGGIASNGSPLGVYYGADTTFYGAGVTDYYNGNKYWSYGVIQHDYANAYLHGLTSPTDEVLNTGPIQNDPGDTPYDKYTVNVVNPCGGYSTCY